MARVRQLLLSCQIFLLIGLQLSLVSSSDNVTTTASVTGVLNTTDHESTEEPGHGEREENDRCKEDEEAFRSEVHIAKVEFERVQTVFIVTVFIMVVVLAKLGNDYDFFMIHV